MGSHRFGITNLGSGSSGNATVIHTPEGSLLVDAGFSGRELHARLALCGIDPGSIKAVLISHDHGDHTKGCRIFSDAYDIPCYTTSITCKSLTKLNRIGKKRIVFTAGVPFSVAGITVEPFSVPHDAPDTVAFNFLHDGYKISIATDLGSVNSLASMRLTDADAILLESNHDEKMLAASGRPLQTIRRIMSNHGHLSNTAAMQTLDTILTDKTRFLLFGHLSAECNSRDLVEEMAHERLDYLDRNDITYRIAEQSTPTETFWVI